MITPFKKNSKIFVAGHNGMVGSAIIRMLKKNSFKNLIVKSKKQLNLLDQREVFSYLEKTKPDFVIIAAAKVGGILANDKYRADFIYENLQIQNNLIHGSYISKVKKLIFLGSSCIYPRDSKQPIKEKYLLTNSLEYTNEPYAIAKIAGIKMVENYNLQYKTNYLCLMPCNLYGPNDNYDLKTSHFLPALISKIHNAKITNSKIVNIWGTGKPKRELMYVDDLADACLHFMYKENKTDLINIGTGEEYSIKQYVKIVCNIIGYKGKVVFDHSKPDGTPRKILDSSLAYNYGWMPKVKLREGLKFTYKDFLKNYTKMNFIK